MLAKRFDARPLPTPLALGVMVGLGVAALAIPSCGGGVTSTGTGTGEQFHRRGRHHGHGRHHGQREQHRAARAHRGRRAPRDRGGGGSAGGASGAAGASGSGRRPAAAPVRRRQRARAARPAQPAPAAARERPEPAAPAPDRRAWRRGRRRGRERTRRHDRHRRRNRQRGRGAPTCTVATGPRCSGAGALNPIRSAAPSLGAQNPSGSGSLSSYNYLQMVAYWIESGVTGQRHVPHVQRLQLAVEPRRRLEPIPVYYAYMIGYFGHMNGLPDGNINPNGPNLATGGAALIKANRAEDHRHVPEVRR